MFYDNYVRLCNSVNKTPSAVALEIGIAKPTVTRWKSGSKPNRSTLLKVADYFHVPVDFLTGDGSSVYPDDSAPMPHAVVAESEAEERLLAYFRNLSPASQEMVLQVAANAAFSECGKNKAVSDMETAQ